MVQHKALMDSPLKETMHMVEDCDFVPSDAAGIFVQRHNMTPKNGYNPSPFVQNCQSSGWDVILFK